MIIYQSRMKVIISIIVIVCAIFIIRLFQLQLIAKKYKKFAKDNALQERIIYPPRGLIYDRHGKIIVSNEVMYDLMVIPNQVKMLDTNEFCKIMKINRDYFISTLKEAKVYSQNRASVFLKNLTVADYGILQEKLFEFRGFYVQARTTRKYPFNILAHVLGYIGEVNESQIAKSDGYYHKGDYIGVSGLEEYYEEELRGVNGVSFILVDAFNCEQGSYAEGELDQESSSGSNLLTSIDLELQIYAEKLLTNKKGSIVALVPKTGEILVMASSPTYNPVLLTGRERTAHYKELIMDPDKPLFNRAITAMYPPGSSFKIVEAAIGLQEGVLLENTSYGCAGGYYIGNLRIGCHNHASPLNLHYAIALSCNSYFCNVFRTIIDQKRFKTTIEGYNNWRMLVSEFGIGSKLGVDLKSESPGILPTYKRYDKIYGKGRWHSTNILSLAIGQAEISLTPLQLANVAAIIANKGYYYQPHFVKAIIKNGQSNSIPYQKNVVHVSPEYFDIIADAMYDVVRSGTGYSAYVDSLFICGKTGTAQNPHGKDHSIFIAYAPKDNPRIAIAVIIENAGFGATWAAPVSSLIIQKYLTDTIPQNRKWVEESVMKFNLYQGGSGSTNKKADSTKNGAE